MSDLHRQICEAIAAQGGRAFLVGGCVRDTLLGIAPQDIDCEVHGLAPDALHALLTRYGEVDQTGERFGVFTLKREEFDFALPRIERRTGSAHTDFDITPIPDLTPREAAARRDFTVNAIMMDALTGEIIDPYGGEDDLRRGVLRAVPGGQFTEDPLRVLRGAQFAARFALWPDEETLSLMQRMPLGEISAQRAFSETKKALLQAERPGVYLSVLGAAKALTPWFTELCGNHARSHAVCMLDSAASLRSRAKEPLLFMLAAMTHGLDREAAEVLLTRLSVNRSGTAYCGNLVMQQREMISGDVHANLVFDRCACPQDLALLCIACGGEEAVMAKRLRLYEEAVSRPMPTGRMLMEAGVMPGSHMKHMVHAAREMALLGMDAQEAIRLVIKEKAFSCEGKMTEGRMKL